jgi:hypothetical protein
LQKPALGPFLVPHRHTRATKIAAPHESQKRASASFVALHFMQTTGAAAVIFSMAGAGGWLVVAAAINDMKADLSLDEAREAWRLLATGPGDGGAVDALEMLLRRLAHFRPRAAVRSTREVVNT